MLSFKRSRTSLSFTLSALTMFPTSGLAVKPSPCPSESDVKAVARQLWSDSAHSAIADYKVCRDGLSCFAEDCGKGLGALHQDSNVNTETAEFRGASRPFVMCSKTQPAQGTIMLAHGLSDSPETFQAVAGRLQNEGYNVVAILLSGHGADSVKSSTNPDPTRGLTSVNWLKDVDHGIALATQLFGDTALSIGGFSTGGALALEWLQEHRSGNLASGNKPIKSAILFDPALALPDEKCDVINKNGFLNLIKNEVAYWLLGKNSGAAYKNFPNRSPIPMMVGGKALCEVQKMVAENQTPIATPTIAFFSGSGRPTFGSAIDAEKSKQELCGSDGQLGKVKVGSCFCTSYRDETHAQLPAYHEFAGCNYAKLENGRFQQMMDQVVGFLHGKTDKFRRGRIAAGQIKSDRLREFASTADAKRLLVSPEPSNLN